MTRRTKWSWQAKAILCAVAFVTLCASPLNAGLIYQQNFDDGNGAADVGVGDLAITNTGGGSPGNTFFSSTGGIVGGSYNATSNVSGNNSASFNGIASTAATGGTALSTLPNSGTLN